MVWPELRFLRLTEVVSWCDRGAHMMTVHGINASIEPDHDIRSNVDVMRQVWDDEEVVTQMLFHLMSTAQMILEVAMVVNQGLRGKRLCLATCGRLLCLCFRVLNRFRLIAEFSAHRASAVSDTDVLWISNVVMI